MCSAPTQELFLSSSCLVKTLRSALVSEKLKAQSSWSWDDWSMLLWRSERWKTLYRSTQVPVTQHRFNPIMAGDGNFRWTLSYTVNCQSIFLKTWKSHLWCGPMHTSSSIYLSGLQVTNIKATHLKNWNCCLFYTSANEICKSISQETEAAGRLSFFPEPHPNFNTHVTIAVDIKAPSLRIV